MAELLPTTLGLASSLGLTVEMNPTVEQIDSLLRGIAKELQDFRPAWRRISSEVLLPSIKTAFATGTSQEGEKWAPLSPGYKARKDAREEFETYLKERNVSGETLVGTGTLRTALTQDSGRYSQRSFGKKIAKIGTTLPYALAQQWGYGVKSRSAASRRVGSERPTRSAGKRSAVPARQFISWTDSMRQRAAEIVVEYLQFVTDNQVALLGGKVQVT